jgi:hypothetical protein
LLDNLLRGLELVSSVRKFVKIALVACLAITAVPAALFASLWLWTWFKTAQVESFYRENRLLGEMRARRRSKSHGCHNGEQSDGGECRNHQTFHGSLRLPAIGRFKNLVTSSLGPQ